MGKISETERAAMSALGASLEQTDAVLEELAAACRSKTSSAQAELNALRGLVREMGEILQIIAEADTCLNTVTGSDALAVYPPETRTPAREILNRPEVIKILQEEQDNEPR